VTTTEVVIEPDVDGWTLARLDFVPPCDVGRGGGPHPVCERSAVWVMRILEPPCAHQHPFLWCQLHKVQMMASLTSYVRIQCAHCAAPITPTSISWRRLR